MIRVILPYHLRRLAQSDAEVHITVEGDPTLGAVLDAVEVRYPMLRGTIRDHVTKQRRPFLRFYACGEDFTLESPECRLPEKVVSGDEEFMIVGAIAGG